MEGFGSDAPNDRPREEVDIAGVKPVAGRPLTIVAGIGAAPDGCICSKDGICGKAVA